LKPQSGKEGFSLIELLLVVAIILIIAGLAIPNLMRSRIAANEASAVGTIHAINSALINYASTFDIGYPASFSYLAPSAMPTSTAADLLDSIVVSGKKSGYHFVYTPGSVSAGGAIDTYSITGQPLVPGTTGQRNFYSDQSLVIHYNATGPATANDPPLG
jgi:type IV pilus assembly protein PilA